MEIKLDVPELLDGPNALEFALALRPTEGATRYRVDFAPMGRVTPSGMLILAAELKRFRETLPGMPFLAVNVSDHTYAAHMGLFKAFGVDWGNEPGEAPGGPTYLPLTIVARSALADEAKARREGIIDTVEWNAKRLARLLLQRDAGQQVDLLGFALREVLRNVIEHSKSDRFAYAGQYWPKSGDVEVAIVDQGIGIRASLSRNPHLKIESDADAIRMALLPGVSGSVFQGRPPDPNDDWANSGYGLYMLSGLCRDTGSFLIGSGHAALLMDTHRHRPVRSYFGGTVLSLRIALKEAAFADKLMQKLREEGEKHAREIKGAIITPSAASQFLRRN